MHKIPFKKLNIIKSYKTVKPLFKSGMIGLGDSVFQFEKEFARYVGAKYVVAVNSCTSALFLSLLWDKKKLGIKEVWIPSMTVPLVANAVLQAGLKLNFNDNTYWVGSSYSIGNSTVVDSAHEIQKGSVKGLPIGTKVCYSFYPTKTIGSADGGAIATNDKDFADWARQASLYGRTQTTKRQSSWDYDITMLGYKMNWNNLQADIAREQLSRIDTTIAWLRVLVSFYNLALYEINSSLYLYRINVENRDKFIKYMAKNGVECGVHFKPLHLMRPFGNIEIDNPTAVRREYERTVSLPLYSSLNIKEVSYICKLVNIWKNGR